MLMLLLLNVLFKIFLRTNWFWPEKFSKKEKFDSANDRLTESSHCEFPTYEIDEEKYRLVAIRHHAQRLVYNLTSHEITYKQLKTNTLNNFLQSNFFSLHFW